MEESIAIYSGNPNEQDLKKINQYRLAGTEPLQAENIFVTSMLVSDNLLHRDRLKWSSSTLETMVLHYEGKDVLLNHAWGDSRQVSGVVFDGFLLEAKAPSNKLVRQLITESPNQKADRNILKQEGYQAVILRVAVTKPEEIIAMKNLQRVDLSVGGRVINRQVLCPICNTTFDDEDCEHIIPDPWLLWLYDLDPDDPRIAPYWIEDCNFLSQEISSCVVGLNPRARCVLEKDLQILNLFEAQ